MSMFIEIEVTDEVVKDKELAERLSEACPVDIYAQAGDGTLEIVEDNVDECVLCRLCLDLTPENSITVKRLYEDGKPL
jgi:NAD-dependent dihydropyrimidine dehydrogenase PreA subunit